MTSEQDNVRNVLANPNQSCPPEILKQQVAVEVGYLDFDGVMQLGIIEVNESVSDDVRAFFDYAVAINFPIQQITPGSDSAFMWDDTLLMEANVTSGFNYRVVSGTNKPSLHGKGLAFDLNPRQNPYIRYSNGLEIIAPVNATWQPSKPGTLSAQHPLVKFMTKRGWEWGGSWSAESGRIDYQHFQKNTVTT